MHTAIDRTDQRNVRACIAVVGANPAVNALLCLHLRSHGYDAKAVDSDTALNSLYAPDRYDHLIACDLAERELRDLLPKFSRHGQSLRVIGVRANRINTLSHVDGPSRRVLELLQEIGFSCSHELYHALLLTAA
jgi:hypothetical protein